MTDRSRLQLADELDAPEGTRSQGFVTATDSADGTADTAQALDHFVVKNNVECAGTHLIVDLYGAENLNDLAFIEQTLRQCIDAAQATLLHIHLHHFTPNNGVSGVAVLAESHISIHTWPERSYAALDIFMCGDTRPELCIEILRSAFKPSRLVVGEHLRGQGA